MDFVLKNDDFTTWGQAPTATVTNHKVFKNHIVVEGEEGGVPKVK